MNFVGTKENIADILTKPLNCLDTTKFRGFIAGKIQTPLRALIAGLTKLNALRHKKL